MLWMSCVFSNMQTAFAVDKMVANEDFQNKVMTRIFYPMELVFYIGSRLFLFFKNDNSRDFELRKMFGYPIINKYKARAYLEWTYIPSCAESDLLL